MISNIIHSNYYIKNNELFSHPFNPGVTKFLKFMKLMDSLVKPNYCSLNGYYSFFKKKLVYFDFDVNLIITYLSIRFDFNDENDFLKNQKIFITKLKKSELEIVKELIQLYGIENLSLYFAKLKNTNFTLSEFLQYDFILFKPDLNKYKNILEFLKNPVKLDVFNFDCDIIQKLF